MESAYRTWLKARKEGIIPHHLDELGRELQMALGTAKWQLDEFERAVRLSYRNKDDDITITRHSQFVSAIEDQISRVETALKEFLNMEAKKPFRWVNLDQEECDDLALFLSGTSDECNRTNTENDSNSEEVLTSNDDSSETCSGAKRVLSHAQMRMINWINQHLRGCHKSQRQLHISPVSPINSIRFVLAFMLTIFLVVPFLLYST